ncbi:MAG: glycosyltransferase [Prosthecobacter sp.]|nr:glycosyltransferase [Prosthecobacter sp.]
MIASATPPEFDSALRLPRTAVLTDFSSPYQVELFDEIERQCPGRLLVCYLKSRSHMRNWSLPVFKHDAILLDGEPSEIKRAEECFAHAELAVFNFYDDAKALRLIRQRAKLDTAFCFWGEQPGYYSKLVGRLRRMWMLRSLHERRAAIWGIGRLAVNAYREEFGAFRSYVNLPYFSDLTRFQAIPSRRPQTSGETFTILYSGALIRRKGVDLVAGAFARLAADQPQVRLRIMGGGPMERSLRRILTKCAAQVEFAGFKDWASLPDEYVKAEVLCVPSRYDGWGLVVPEGLAAGLPVISTTQTGAAVEFLRHGENGWLVAANDEDAIFRAMLEAVSLDPTRLAAMSAAARATVAEHSLVNGARRFIQAAESAASDW